MFHFNFFVYITIESQKVESVKKIYNKNYYYMINYKTVKIKEGSYYDLIDLQCMLLRQKNIKINKSNLMNFLINKFKKQIEEQSDIQLCIKKLALLKKHRQAFGRIWAVDE